MKRMNSYEKTTILYFQIIFSCRFDSFQVKSPIQMHLVQTYDIILITQINDGWRNRCKSTEDRIACCIKFLNVQNKVSGFSLPYLCKMHFIFCYYHGFEYNCIFQRELSGNAILFKCLRRM